MTCFLSLFSTRWDDTNFIAQLVQDKQQQLQDSGKDFMRDMSVTKAVDQMLDFLLNGYCQLWEVIKFTWYAHWQSHLQFNHTLNKAMTPFLAKKSNFLSFWTALYMQTLQKLMTASAALPHSGYAMILQHLTEVADVIKMSVLPMINDASVTTKVFWTRISLLFTVNERRADSNGIKGRLSFASADFQFEWKQAMADSDVQAKATLGLTEETIAALNGARGTTASNTVLKDRNGDIVGCYKCSGNHFASKCPENSKSSTTLKAAQKEIRELKRRENSTKNYRTKQRQQQYVQPMMGGYPTYGTSYPWRSLQCAPQMHQMQMMQQMQPPHMLHQQQQQQPQLKEPAKKRQKQGSGAGAAFYSNQNGYLMLKPEHYSRSPCRWFEGQMGRPCNFDSDPTRCAFPHACSKCHQTTHNTANCTNVPNMQFAAPQMR